jgi:hypothetical protein
MRDIMAALTQAGDLNRTLEIILVNLRNVIHYDRAGLYLLDEEQRYVLADRSRLGQVGSTRSYLTVDPLVAALKEARKPSPSPTSRAICVSTPGRTFNRLRDG